MINEPKIDEDPFLLIQPALLIAAYGNSTLGMPLMGYKSALENLNSDVFNDFLQEQALPSRIVFGADGIRNHDEFVYHISKITSRIPPLAMIGRPRVKSVFKGGEARIHKNLPLTSLSLCFESIPCTHEDAIIYDLLSYLPKITFDNTINAEVVNLSFSDSGLFGFTVKGPCEKAKEISDIVIKKLKEGFTSSEIQQAKDNYKVKVANSLNEPRNALEELIKNVF